MCSLYIYTSQYLKENFTLRCITFSLKTDIGNQAITFFQPFSLLITIIQSFTTNINVNTATLHIAKHQKSLNSTHCKIFEWRVLNEKMNRNSMRNMNKDNTSVLIQERDRLNVSKNLTICSLMVVFWDNVMNEQWQINNLISWKFLFKTPSVNPKKQLA